MHAAQMLHMARIVMDQKIMTFLPITLDSGDQRNGPTARATPAPVSYQSKISMVTQRRGIGQVPNMPL